MRKTLKRILPFVLILSLMLCMSVPAFAATVDNVKHYESMTVLGDSIPCAHGYPTCTNFGVSPGSYPDVLSKLLGLDGYCSLAFCGCSLTTILYMLGIEVDLGNVQEMRDFVLREVGEGTWATLEAIREGRNKSIGDLYERLSSSDLITINVGSNDLCHIPYSMFKHTYDTLVSEGMSTSEALTKSVGEFARFETMGLEYFMTAYPQIIEKLKSINPDATIVIVGAYNPFINTCLFEGFEDFNSGKLVSSVVKLENTQLKLWAKQYDCVYADVFDISYSFKGQCLTHNYDKMGGLSTHPTFEGHKWMAEQILKALPTAEKKLCMPQNTSARVELGGVDIGEYTLERGFLGWTLNNMTGEYVVPTNDNRVTSGDNSSLWGYDGGFYCIGKIVKNTDFGFKYLTIKKLYLTSDADRALSLSSERVKADLYVKS